MYIRVIFLRLLYLLERIKAGANPTTVSYNASVVKIYNATNSLVRFENKNIFIYL
jgi:hypothetical protein